MLVIAHIMYQYNKMQFSIKWEQSAYTHIKRAHKQLTIDSIA